MALRVFIFSTSVPPQLHLYFSSFLFPSHSEPRINTSVFLLYPPPNIFPHPSLYSQTEGSPISSVNKPSLNSLGGPTFELLLLAFVLHGMAFLLFINISLLSLTHLSLWTALCPHVWSSTWHSPSSRERSVNASCCEVPGAEENAVSLAQNPSDSAPNCVLVLGIENKFQLTWVWSWNSCQSSHEN